ncbi:MAG: aminomethyl-transferring glycine dehydrogenase subunit GcvPA [Candidatus Bipolaricaulis sp.]|nr:aminomethyl-transferring glycine dehydrogenase subunit GcvPA [Candidatus Bipolaricaulis sp.]
MRYIPNADADRQVMLREIGRRSIDALFADVPQAVIDAHRPLGLAAKSELEVLATLTRLAEVNTASRRIPLLGGGIYDHYVPRVVHHLASRSEFVTAYTPYQPEISQGTLTVMFEFQTMVCELLGMEIANASMYDGATALAEAALMAERIRKRGKVAVAANLFSHQRRVLQTYAWAAGIELVDVPFVPSGRSDLSRLPDGISALVLQSPNAFGVLEDLDGLKGRLGEALLIVSTYPLAMGALQPPGAFGADIVVGEGQCLGLAMGYGGPLLGLFATRKEHLRQLPGRVAGRTVDVDGRVGYTMTAQTREQHIRREKATSNICTNSAHCALTATVYLASLGAVGLRDVALLNLEKAHYLATRIAKLKGYSLVFDAPFFNEFVVRPSDGDADAMHQRLEAEGFLVESPGAMAELGVPNALRIAVTERRTREELDRIVKILGGKR